jgi:hypothetical protein
VGIKALALQCQFLLDFDLYFRAYGRLRIGRSVKSRGSEHNQQKATSTAFSRNEMVYPFYLFHISLRVAHERPGILCF